MQKNVGISFYFLDYESLKRAAHALDRAVRTRLRFRHACILYDRIIYPKAIFIYS